MLKPMPKNLFQPGLCAWPWPTARGVQPARLRARDCAVGGETGGGEHATNCAARC